VTGKTAAVQFFLMFQSVMKMDHWTFQIKWAKLYTCLHILGEICVLKQERLLMRICRLEQTHLLLTQTVET